jgi:hypothetical protein
MDTFRCVQCGMPGMDHVPLRYFWRAWWRHSMLRMFSPLLNRIDDTGDQL